MNLIRPAHSLALAGALTAALFAAEPVVTQAKKQIADKKYDEAITSLEAASKANPKSVEIKNTLVEALLAKADSVMADDAAPPRTKYPTALRAYRQVLTVDKDNKKAQTNIATIEGIYKSMGRPIPQ
jgi:tetratricopeptide (TPR) repeat protein